MTGEALKTIVREVWGLGGQVINGAAAAILHITLEPGTPTHPPCARTRAQPRWWPLWPTLTSMTMLRRACDAITTHHPGYNVHRRRRIEKHDSASSPSPRAGTGAAGRGRASSSDSGESVAASSQALVPSGARSRGGSTVSAASTDPHQAQSASWFGRLLSTAASLLEESDASSGDSGSGSDSGASVGAGSTQCKDGAGGERPRRLRLYTAGAAAAATATASRITPRRLPAQAGGNVAGTGASTSAGSWRGGGGGGGGGTGHGSQSASGTRPAEAAAYVDAGLRCVCVSCERSAVLCVLRCTV